MSLDEHRAANLANWMGWMSDGPIIRGWQLLRGGTPRKGETPRMRFLEAVDRGLPIYAEGLRLLIDGLKVLARAKPKDREVATAIDEMGPYAEATDWSRSVLTFNGDGPDAPGPIGMPRPEAGSDGIFFLYSTTIDDLVAHGLVRPGTELKFNASRMAGYRMDLAGEAATVTQLGAVVTHPWGETLHPTLAIPGRREDPWTAWSTPDDDLSALRQIARERPPLTEAERHALPVEELGLRTRTANLLTKAGITTVGDLADADVDRLNAITGVGHKTVEDVVVNLRIRGLSLASQ